MGSIQSGKDLIFSGFSFIFKRDSFCFNNTMGSDHFALFGLGNPGNTYEQTRHNAGFRFLDWFAARNNVRFSADKYHSLSASIREGRNRITLLKPQTFMNRSGRSVAGFTNYYDIDPAEILVVHDDIDMANGRMKLVLGGGAGGHNGIRSIISELGTPDFYRLKIGVGRPGSDDTPAQMDVEKYVLAPFSSGQIDQIVSRFEELADGLAYYFRGEIGRAQTLVNAIK